MTEYVTINCDNLTRVLKRAVALKPHRLVGYAANLDFWLNELSHCLELIDGFEVRRTRAVEAMTNHMGRVDEDDLYEHVPNPSFGPHERDVVTDWQKFRRTLAGCRKRLVESATVFLRRLLKEDLLDQEVVWRTEDRFSISIRAGSDQHRKKGP